MRLHLFTALQRHPWIRRTLAIIAMANLAGVAVEFNLPDVHDGDAAAVAPVVTTQSSPLAGSGGTPQSQDQSSGHAVHVDHCAHAHLLAAVEEIQPDASAQPPVHVFSRLISLHDSVKNAPLSRPPIA